MPASVELPLLRHRLANGLRVVLHRDPALPLVALNLWYHVGSKDERPGRTGLAHLFEHMLFQGSRQVGTNDHFRWIQRVGGVANGSTWFDRTNYYETLPADCLDLGLWLEAERMGHLLPALTPEKLETQREVVINERRQRVDNQPYGRAYERLHELLYPPHHPYHWPVIGYLPDLERLTLAEVAEFFRAYYAPNNAVLTLAGAFDPEDALARIERYLGPIPAAGDPPRHPPAEAPLAGEIRDTLPDDVELARVYLAYPLTGIGSDDWYAADLLSRLLAGGKSSPLYRDLVYERQLAQEVSLFVEPTELAAAFVLVATARPEVDPGRLEAAAGEHLRAAAAGPPPEADLQRAHNRLRADFYEQLQTVDRRADLLSLYTTYFDDPGRVATELDRYLDLGGEAVADFARRRLLDAPRVALTVRPRSRPG